jgi:hypothetical protein
MKFLLFLVMLAAAIFGGFWLLVRAAKAGNVLPPAAAQKVLALAGQFTDAQIAAGEAEAREANAAILAASAAGVLA